MFKPTSPGTRVPCLSLGCAAIAALALAPVPALAEEAAPAFLTQANANILWTMLAAFLVMFMQAGFALVEAGFTRAKNAGNIMMKNFLDFAAGVPIYFLVGYALMFGDDIGGFLGGSGFALSGAAGLDADGMWTLAFWFFQSVFAATAATIVSGAMAERTRFGAYILVSIVITGLIYPISGHWAWGGGWLSSMGFLDFAGSTVVHSVGGWAALAGAMVLGPRLGKYSPDGKARAIPGHNIPMAGLGVFILWFGWFGFNAGSTVTADGAIGYIAANTCLAGCAGMAAAMVTAWIRFGKPDMSMSMNGALAGLVAITAGCSEVSPVGALVIGFCAGILAVLSVVFVDQALRIDDPVGAVSVHGVCGAFGTLMVGLFASPDFGSAAGLFYGGGIGLFVTQLIGVAAVFVWAFGAGFILMQVLKVSFGLRASAEEELKGLDITEHGSEAYSGFQIFSNE
ncbi:MAG: ammonium transporter [Thermodesulfobacteriota bacterium]